MRRLLLSVLIALTLASLIYAQDPKRQPLSPIARLRAAKTVYLKDSGGSDFPYRLFESSIEGWGRLLLVKSPENADITIEISAPFEDSEFGVSSTTTTTSPTGAPIDSTTEKSIKTSKQLSIQRINVTVFDAHTNVRLWSASEKPKSAFKQKAKEDNIVEATQTLFSQFRDVIEPTTAPSSTP